MKTVIVSLFLLTLRLRCGLCQVCPSRGVPCGKNSVYCHDEASENWTCTCRQGFENTDPNKGDRFSCTDINECRIHAHRCGDTTWCNNTEGGYECLCLDGFERLQVIAGRSVCSDVNECERSPRCPENSICVNIPGSYNCTCPTGFIERDGFCYDVDECSSAGPNLCGVTSVCINTVGSYMCRCPNGVINDTCPEPIINEDRTTASSVPENNGRQAVDVQRTDEERNGDVTGSPLTEAESKNTSMYLGVGLGLGLVLIGCVFVVTYLLYMRKRRRDHPDRAVSTDMSPLKLSSASLTTETGRVEAESRPAVLSQTSKEHQYYTIYPDTDVNTPAKSPPRIDAMYSNHRIQKTQKTDKKVLPGINGSPVHECKKDTVPTNGSCSEVHEGDQPIVYHIFDDTEGTVDGSGCSRVRICSADPKAIVTPQRRLSSSEQLNYATIFGSDAKAGDKAVNVSETVPVSGPSGNSKPHTNKALVQISSPTTSVDTYDRLERRRIDAKAGRTGQYQHLYGNTKFDPTGGKSTKPLSSKPAQYEDVEVPKSLTS